LNIINIKEDTLQIKTFKQNKITGTIKLAKSKLLFLTIPFDEGWTIRDNGGKRMLSRVNFGFSGFVLDKGMHEIVLEYVPRYYFVSSAISIFSILLIISLIIVDFIRKKKIKTST